MKNSNKYTLPQFNNISEIKKHMLANKIELNFVVTEKFARHEGKNIFINAFLEDNVKTFMIVHELAHIANSTSSNNNFSDKFEKEDKKAINALKVMNSSKDSFTFESLMDYYFFHKLKGHL